VVATYDELIEFLAALGTENVPHTKGTFLGHLVAVYRDLAAWGCDEDLCRAGMFHSIYGTERFQKFALPLSQRDAVRRLIGERAERIAFANCFMDRSSFDSSAQQQAGPYRILDRVTGETIELSPAEFDDLCRVHLCDWLEQVPRVRQWDYRRAAYRRLAERLGGPAQAAYDAVFQTEQVKA
jgi:hypothetical protein